MDAASQDGGAAMAQLATAVAPHLRLVSVSKPEPALRAFNVVAVMPSADAARAAVLKLEALDKSGEDNRVAVVVMGEAGTPPPAAVDPGGVARSIAPRVVVGALIGLAVGAGLGAVLAAVFDVSVAGAALAGAALFGVIGAIWAAFARFGGSDAYRQTFVEPRAREVSLVSFHTDDAQRADEAFDRLAAAHPTDVVVLDHDLAATRRSTPTP